MTAADYRPATWKAPAMHPKEATPASLSAALAPFGAVKRAHLETNNSGKPAGFAYVEFGSAAAAAAARAATGTLALGGRSLSLAAYTPEANYRKPDGSRAKRAKAAH